MHRAFALLASIFFFSYSTLGFAAQTDESDKPFKVVYHRYWTPPEFTDFKNPFEYEKEVLTKVYLCEEEYLLGLAKRGFVQTDMKLSQRQISDVEHQLDKFDRLHKLDGEIKKSVKTGNIDPVGKQKLESLQNDFIELRKSILKSFRRTFTLEERTRLRNFRNRITLKTNGVKSTILNLPGLCNSTDYTVSQELVQQHKQIEQSIRKFCLTYRSRTKVEPPKEIANGPLVFWLSEVVGEQQALKFKEVYFELGHGYFPELIMKEFNSFEESELAGSASTLPELWERKGQFVIHPDGTTIREIEKTSTPSAKVLLENLAKSSTYQRFFEMTQPQREAAAEFLAEIENEDKEYFREKSVKDVLGQVLLSHQVELIEERAAWREVELYGVVAAIIHGRLGNSLKLSSKQKTNLREKAKSICTSFDDYEIEKDKRLDAELEKFLNTNGLGELFDAAFGRPPTTWNEGDDE